MKKILAVSVLILLVAAAGCLGSESNSNTSNTTGTQTLVVYSYKSFQSIAKAAIPKFEEKYGVKVQLVTIGDAGEVLNRLILEKDNPKADVVVGIDNSYLQKALDAGILEPYRPKNADVIPKWIIDDFDPTFHLTPYDYGAIAVVYKKDEVSNPPKTFEDLTKPEWKGKLIVEDPRTSSTGMGFFLWTIKMYGERWPYYWEKLRENDVRIVDSWDAGWEIWDKSKGMLFVSYATDPAYDSYYANNSEPNIGAILLNGTAYVQIEGAGIVKGAKHPELAKKFIEWLLTPDFQDEIPTHQWMYPVNPNAKLPEAYKYAAKVENPVTLKPSEIANKYNTWLKQWVALMVQGKSPEEVLNITG